MLPLSLIGQWISGVQITTKYLFKITHIHILFKFSFVYFIGTDGKALEKYVTCLSHCSPLMTNSDHSAKHQNYKFQFPIASHIIKYKLKKWKLLLNNWRSFYLLQANSRDKIRHCNQLWWHVPQYIMPMSAMVVITTTVLSFSPERNRGRWRRQSRGRRTRSHILLPCYQINDHISSFPDMTAWFHAMPHL